MILSSSRIREECLGKPKYLWPLEHPSTSLQDIQRTRHGQRGSTHQEGTAFEYQACSPRRSNRTPGCMRNMRLAENVPPFCFQKLLAGKACIRCSGCSSRRFRRALRWGWWIPGRTSSQGSTQSRKCHFHCCISRPGKFLGQKLDRGTKIPAGTWCSWSDLEAKRCQRDS